MAAEVGPHGGSPFVGDCGSLWRATSPRRPFLGFLSPSLALLCPWAPLGPPVALPSLCRLRTASGNTRGGPGGSITAAPFLLQGLWPWGGGSSPRPEALGWRFLAFFPWGVTPGLGIIFPFSVPPPCLRGGRLAFFFFGWGLFFCFFFSDNMGRSDPPLEVYTTDVGNLFGRKMQPHSVGSSNCCRKIGGAPTRCGSEAQPLSPLSPRTLRSAAAVGPGRAEEGAGGAGAADALQPAHAARAEAARQRPRGHRAGRRAQLHHRLHPVLRGVRGRQPVQVSPSPRQLGLKAAEKLGLGLTQPKP